jgi:hypothetical protein
VYTHSSCCLALICKWPLLLVRRWRRGRSSDVAGIRTLRFRDPLRLAFRAREGIGWWRDNHLSRVSSEGRTREVVEGRQPPPSRFRTREGVGWWWRETPPRLAFRAREGVGWWWRDNPLRLTFRAREGMWWWWRDNPLSSEGGVRVVVEKFAFRAREGVGWWWRDNPCCVVRRASRHIFPV